MAEETAAVTLSAMNEVVVVDALSKEEGDAVAWEAAKAKEYHSR